MLFISSMKCREIWPKMTVQLVVGKKGTLVNKILAATSRFFSEA